jgi:hypothetical protein
MDRELLPPARRGSRRLERHVSSFAATTYSCDDGAKRRFAAALTRTGSAPSSSPNCGYLECAPNVLLIGPPGVGKTMLVGEATTNE